MSWSFKIDYASVVGVHRTIVTTQGQHQALSRRLFSEELRNI